METVLGEEYSIGEERITCAKCGGGEKEELIWHKIFRRSLFGHFSIQHSRFNVRDSIFRKSSFISVERYW